jgi:hypothetical protein
MRQTSEPEFAARKEGGGKRVQVGGDRGTNGVCLLVENKYSRHYTAHTYFCFSLFFPGPLEINGWFGPQRWKDVACVSLMRRAE